VSRLSVVEDMRERRERERQEDLQEEINKELVAKFKMDKCNTNTQTISSCRSSCLSRSLLSLISSTTDSLLTVFWAYSALLFRMASEDELKVFQIRRPPIKEDLKSKMVYLSNCGSDFPQILDFSSCDPIQPYKCFK
jgi:hypothetical protein